MTASGETSSRRYGWLLAAAAAIGVVVWLAWRPEPERPARDQPRSEPAEPVVQPAAPPPPPAKPAPAMPAKTVAAKLEVADDGLPFMPEDPNEPRPDGPVHPHPITPQHERIFQENRLIGALNGAMDVKDVAGLRKLLNQYRDEYPEDSHVLQDGYEIVADCLERRDEATIARAQRFFDTKRSSALRRYVRRHCLEDATD